MAKVPVNNGFKGSGWYQIHYLGKYIFAGVRN